MSIIHYSAYCPNCDYKLEIEEDTKRNSFVILDNGHIVFSCPNCFIPLIVIDGVLKED